MSLDWLTLDRHLHDAVKRWRRASLALRQLDPAMDGAAHPSPLVGAPLSAEQLAELDKYDEPLARAISSWLHTLAGEHAHWDKRVAWARRWSERAAVPHRDHDMSARELRGAMLSAGSPAQREPHARALVARALPMSDIRIAELERRLEGDGVARWLGVADADHTLATAAAARLLAATHDAAEPWQRRGFIEGTVATIGKDANRGWPARLTPRWLGEVFARSGLTSGLQLPPLRLPRAWGACSFSRALAQLGRATLAASRPKGLPFALHERPRSVRRHVRAATFALMTTQQAFARRVLGLGKDHARDHRRAVTAAMLCALRLDALRLLLTSALTEGKEAAQTCFAEQTGRLFGDAAPRGLLAVLPELHPADAPAFVGALLAVEEHAALVSTFDEDWFDNPRAAGHLREVDGRPDEPRELELPALEGCMETLVRSLAGAFS